MGRRCLVLVFFPELRHFPPVDVSISIVAYLQGAGVGLLPSGSPKRLKPSPVGQSWSWREKEETTPFPHSKILPVLPFYIYTF